jgi:hypothetical protein
MGHPSVYRGLRLALIIICPNGDIKGESVLRLIHGDIVQATPGSRGARLEELYAACLDVTGRIKTSHPEVRTSVCQEHVESHLRRPPPDFKARECPAKE